MQEIWDRVIEQRKRVEHARLLTRYADDEMEAVNLWYHEQQLMYSLHKAAKNLAEVQKYEKSNASELRARLGMNEPELEPMKEEEMEGQVHHWLSEVTRNKGNRKKRSMWRGLKKWHHSLIVNWFEK